MEAKFGWLSTRWTLWDSADFNLIQPTGIPRRVVFPSLV